MQRKSQESIYQLFNQGDNMLTSSKDKSVLINFYFGSPIKKKLCLLPGNDECEKQIKLKLENNDEAIAQSQWWDSNM